jgi:uncharacterized protein with von Willebrand factor type A (vWA) domain
VPSNLLHNLILFGRLLRGLGLDVNPGRMMDLVHALEHIDIGRRDDFYHAARSLLVHQREDIALFDQAFEMFWQRPVEQWERIDLHLGVRKSRRRPLIAASAVKLPEDKGQDHPQEEPREDEPPILELTRTYSAREVLRQRDFADLTADELEAMKRLMSELMWQLGQRRTRRKRPGRGHQLDLRRTLRRSLKHGGEVLEWDRRERRYKPRPVVILADISGSMEHYTRPLLHFIYSLTKGLDQRVEAFVFGTRLTCISRQMRERAVERALGEVSRRVPDWSGGTRIGETLKDFNFIWARRVLGNGAVVLLISDGWDRGDPELLKREMGRLSRSCYRLVWLNPLLGSPEYEPLTRGMQAALPFVDDFMPVHNLASLEELALHLSELDRKRAPRGRWMARQAS